MFSFIKSISKLQILAIVLVLIGLGLVIFFGIRTVRSYRELTYIQQEGLDVGTADLDAIRPWMTPKFVAVAYAVPQEYLFAELGIPFDRWNSNEALGRLNREFEPDDKPSKDVAPIIIDKVKEAIEKYRENPVPTGLEDDVRAWMSIQYIANSTGVPAEYIFEQIGVPAEGNENKPLDRLDEELNYPGGRRALVETVQNALSQYGENRWV